MKKIITLVIMFLAFASLGQEKVTPYTSDQVKAVIEQSTKDTLTVKDKVWITVWSYMLRGDTILPDYNLISTKYDITDTEKSHRKSGIYVDSEGVTVNANQTKGAFRKKLYMDSNGNTFIRVEQLVVRFIQAIRDVWIGDKITLLDNYQKQVGEKLMPDSIVEITALKLANKYIEVSVVDTIIKDTIAIKDTVIEQVITK